MISRDCLPYFVSAISKTPSPENVVLLEGARQVGKTTLLLALAERLKSELEIIQVNFEENKLLYRQIDETKSFAEFTQLLTFKLNLNPEKRQLLIIDEAQESAEIGSYLRFMKEKWPQTFVILSGSSMNRLFRKEQRIPVGRYTTLKLFPFSFKEFLTATNKVVLAEIISSFSPEKEISELFHNELLAAYDQYLRVGGLPAVVNAFSAGHDYETIRSNIIISQEEDFVRKTEEKSAYLFPQALRAISNHLGSSSKYSHVCENTNQAKEILGILSRWHIVLEVEQKGISSTTNFYPKRYLYDLGVAQDMRNMPFSRLSILNTLNSVLRTQLGGLIENAVLLNLIHYKMGNIKLSSWKKSSNDPSEVDFVWLSEAPIPLECKASTKVTNRTFSSVLNFLRESEQRLGFVISASKYSEQKIQGNRLVNLPVYLCSPDTILKIVG